MEGNREKKVNKGVRSKAFLLCDYPDSQIALHEKQEGRAMLEMSLGHGREKIAYRSVLPSVLTLTGILLSQVTGSRETSQYIMFKSVTDANELPLSTTSAKLSLWVVAERRKSFQDIFSTILQKSILLTQLVSPRLLHKVTVSLCSWLPM